MPDDIANNPVMSLFFPPIRCAAPHPGALLSIHGAA